MNEMNRRDFLQKLLHTGVTAGMVGSLSGALQVAQAGTLVRRSLQLQGRAYSDYKALVCIDLKGGNDGFNMIIPTAAGTGNNSYNSYQQARGGVNSRANPQGVALPESNILALSTAAGQPSIGIHHSMPEVRDLFNARKASIVANLGTLVRPTNKTDYQNKFMLPAHLFSHSDQQVLWLTPRADATDRIGWAGRLSDTFHAGNVNTDIPMSISAGGENVLQVGQQTIPFFVATSGANKVRFAPGLDGTCEYDEGQCAPMRQLFNQPQTHPLRKAYAEGFKRALDRNNSVDAALSAFPITHADFAPFWSTFGVTASDENFRSLPRLAQELFVIARLIRVQSTLNLQRQTFYAKMGGFDMHDDLLNDHTDLLADLSKSIAAFQATIDSMGMSDAVTTFTASEFGRTTSSNGDGTDHGWGSHHLVIGGAVDGGKVFGQLPNLSPEKDNPDNANWGQIIPTLSTEQYAATLCQWFGLGAGERDVIFPNLRYMTGSKLAISGADLGFMV